MPRLHSVRQGVAASRAWCGLWNTAPGHAGPMAVRSHVAMRPAAAAAAVARRRSWVDAERGWRALSTSATAGGDASDSEATPELTSATLGAAPPLTPSSDPDAPAAADGGEAMEADEEGRELTEEELLQREMEDLHPGSSRQLKSLQEELLGSEGADKDAKSAEAAAAATGTTVAHKEPKTRKSKTVAAHPMRDRLRTESFDPTQALALARNFAAWAPRKFKEGLQVFVELRLDTRKGDQQVRAPITLPNRAGRKKKIFAICDEDLAKEALAAGADRAESDELIEFLDSVKKPQKHFDVLLCSPDQLPKLRKLAKKLGSKGLMPSAKLGTVTEDMAAAVPLHASRIVNVRTDKFGGVSGRFGSLDMTDEEILENFASFMSAIQDLKPSGAPKGRYINAVHICSTMGPSIQVDLMHATPTSNLFMRAKEDQADLVLPPRPPRDSGEPKEAEQTA